MKKLSIGIAVSALALAASQASATAVTVDVTALTVTASQPVATTLVSTTAGAGDFTVTGTNIGDAAIVSGYWGGAGLVTQVDLNPAIPGSFAATVESINQRVNYSGLTTPAAGAIDNNSPGFSTATCGGAAAALVCAQVQTGTDFASTLNADDGTGVAETTTIVFTSFVDANNFAGTITTVGGTADGIGGFANRTTVYSFASNAPAVPLPAAAWLFGSALVGLAGIARKRRV